LLEFFVVPGGIHRRRKLHGPTPAKLALARQYLQALESGPTGDELARFFAPEVVLEILPSKFFRTAVAMT
jgi:hypothetical protein